MSVKNTDIGLVFHRHPLGFSPAIHLGVKLGRFSTLKNTPFCRKHLNRNTPIVLGTKVINDLF